MERCGRNNGCWRKGNWTRSCGFTGGKGAAAYPEIVADGAAGAGSSGDGGGAEGGREPLGGLPAGTERGAGLDDAAVDDSYSESPGLQGGLRFDPARWRDSGRDGGPAEVGEVFWGWGLGVRG